MIEKESTVTIITADSLFPVSVYPITTNGVLDSLEPKTESLINSYLGPKAKLSDLEWTPLDDDVGDFDVTM